MKNGKSLEYIRNLKENHRPFSKILKFGTILGTLFLCSHLFANNFVHAESVNSQDQFFTSLSSPELEIHPELSESFESQKEPLPPTHGAENYDLNSLPFLEWTPTGAHKNLRPECDFRKIQLFKIASKSTSLLNNEISTFLSKCESDIATGQDNFFSNWLSVTNMRHSIGGNSFIRPVTFRLPGKSEDLHLDGLLALKGDYKKRPLVILRVGIFGTMDGFKGERFLLLQLFEQSPFNMLILESTSGKNYIQNNSQISFGGFEEGLQNYYIARLLRGLIPGKPQPMTKLIGSLHFAGVSLAGHGNYFTTLLNEFNKTENQESSPVIQSFLQFCPLVNFRGNYKNLIQSTWRSKLLNLWASKRLQSVQSRIDPKRSFSTLHFFEEVVDSMKNQFRGPTIDTSALRVPRELEHESDYWQANNFWPYFIPTKSPVLSFSTVQDIIVDYSENSKKLQNGEFTRNLDSVYFHALSRSNHCMLTSVYDWNSLTSIFQSYILTNSPNFNQKISTLKIKQPFHTNNSLENSKLTSMDFVDKAEVEFNVTWSDSEKESKAILNFAPSKSVEFPLNRSDFQFKNLKLTEPEKEMLTRWIHHNVFIKYSPSSDQVAVEYTKSL